MVRGWAWLVLLLGAVLCGCFKGPDPHAKNIPDIPPGRAKVGKDAGEQLPVAPPRK
jgi:hypothetical protein